MRSKGRLGNTIFEFFIGAPFVGSAYAGNWLFFMVVVYRSPPEV